MMSNLSFQEYGSGQAVVLIHGFPFHQQIWRPFAEKLSKTCHVFTVDLPGFGKSASLNTPFTLAQVGESVVSWITGEKLKNPFLIGHSLGGYVALEAAKINPGLFSGLGLFHSTAYADTEEKKQSRNKVLEFINKNGVEAFTANFIGPLFSDPGHPAIPFVRTIASEAKTAAVKGYTEAMRDRSERTSVLQTFPGPVLFLAGEKDAGIPVESIRKQAALTLQSQTEIIPGIAHMGMFENENKCLQIIQTFIEKNTVTR
jgi:pimeloyl-ACP methyl ester carboxylesterase